MALSWTMDKIGPMTRSAEDCAVVLDAMHGTDPLDGTTIGTPARTSDERTSGFRIGLLNGSIEASSTGVATNTRAAVETLRAFATIEEIRLPDLPFDDAASLVIMCEAASAFEEFLDRGDSLKLRAPEVRTGIYHALDVPAVDYIRALRVRSAGAAEIARLLDGFDALIAPAYHVTAPPAVGNFEAYFARHEGPGLSGMGNLVGLPSISVPTGLEDGLPTSLEILGHWWAESTVLAIANEFQQRTSWHLAKPPGNG
jgi:aspartyl-tRNA(Asn)/glutamyl-tRNA(Gln) amidotransferase subunit A